MNSFRTKLSAAVVWAMIPLAAWAGMPSTGCVCANGRLKLFCGHRTAGNEGGCQASCCRGPVSSGGHDAADCDHESGDHKSDRCAGGHCCHGMKSDQSRIASEACCKPIVTAPGVAPKLASAPSHQVPALATVVEQVGALVRPSLAVDVAELDTGPPVDRVILFRSLLI